jgi:hypothetical protein
MRPQLKRPLLYDQHGRTLNYGLYQSPRAQGLRNYRPRPYGAASRDTKDSYSPFDWWEHLNYGRQLFASLPNVGGAIAQKNAWAFGGGWMPRYTGGNPKWGAEAHEWLRDVWMPNCNIRGEPYDFNTSLFNDGIRQDVDGDQLMLLVNDEEYGNFPKLQFLAAHKVKTMGGFDTEVKEGPFKGANLLNGVISDRNQRTLGWRVEVDPRAYNGKNYLDISIFNGQLLYEPEWSDQNRGISRIARIILDSFDYEDITHFLKRAVKLASSQGIKKKLREGQATPGVDPVTTDEDPDAPDANGNPKKVDIEDVRGGEFYYLHTDEDIEEFESQRPHPNTEAFLERLESRGLFALGWFYHLIDPSNLSGAPTRLIQDCARKSVRDRQRTGKMRAKRALGFAIASGMERGFISKNHDLEDALKWSFDMPGEITVDGGNEEQADRENLKMGNTSLAIIAQKKGHYWGEIVNTNLEVNKRIVAAAKALFEESAGFLTAQQSLDLMSQRSPNASPAAAVETKSQEEEDKPSTKKEKAK